MLRYFNRSFFKKRECRETKGRTHKRKNKSLTKDQESELFQTSQLHHWKLKDNRGMTPNSEGKLFPAWNALAAQILIKYRTETLSNTKVLKMFIFHVPFLKKLLETVTTKARV